MQCPLCFYIWISKAFRIKVAPPLTWNQLGRHCHQQTPHSDSHAIACQIDVWRKIYEENKRVLAKWRRKTVGKSNRISSAHCSQQLKQI